MTFCMTLGVPIVAGPWTHDVLTFDCNDDGHLDVVASNYGAGTLSIARGRGDGTFSTQTTWEAGDNPWELATADFNGDGLLDLAVGNFVSGANVLLGGGECEFGAPIQIFGDDPLGEFSHGSRAIAAGDVTGDGLVDVVSEMSGPGGEVPYIAVHPGKGDGTFEPFVTYEMQTGSGSLRLSDINGDGVDDIVSMTSWLWSNQGATGKLEVIVGSVSGELSVGPSATVVTDTSTFDVADFDEDGRLDVITAGGEGVLSLVRGKDEGSFYAQVTIQFGDVTMNDVEAADFDGDGHMDVAIAVGSHNEIYILPGHGDGTFGAAQVFASGNYSLMDSDEVPGYMAVGDFNEDGRPDLAAANYEGEVSILLSGN